VDSGYKNGVVSPDNIAYNGFGNPAELHITSTDSTSKFAFKGGYFTGAWEDDLTLTVQGFLNGVSVGSTAVIINSTAPTQFTFTQFDNVDDVSFSTSGGTNHGYAQAPVTGAGSQFAMDNIVLGCPSGGVSQDPQFKGLQGQRFQVHGLADNVFNLITSPNFQLNSRFVYISNGKCFYNETACWSHPGTYLQSLGFSFYEQHVEVYSDANSIGLEVNINGNDIAASNKRFILTTTHNKGLYGYLSYPTKNRVIYETGLFHIVVTNADFFVNIQVSLLDSGLLKLGRQKTIYSGIHRDDEELLEGQNVLNNTVNPHIHGLIGQTYLNNEYVNGQMFEGEILDYWLESNSLLGNDFLFNQFQY